MTAGEDLFVGLFAVWTVVVFWLIMNRWDEETTALQTEINELRAAMDTCGHHNVEGP